MQLFKKSRKGLEFPKAYIHIDELPILIWNKIHETGDLTLLFVEKQKVNQSFDLKLEEIWLNLYDQFLKEFGVSDEYQKILEIKRAIAIHKIDFHLRGNRAARTYWKIEEAKLKDALTDEPKTSFNDSIIKIEQFMKFKLNARELTVLDYFSYIKHINGAK